MNFSLSPLLPLQLSLITVSEDATGSLGNCYQGSRVSSLVECISKLDGVHVCWSWMWNRSTWRLSSVREGGFCSSDFETAFPMKRGSETFCSVLSWAFLRFAIENKQREKFGGFWGCSSVEIESDDDQVIISCSLSPTSSSISGLSGFTHRFPFFRVTSQVLSHSFFSHAHTSVQTATQKC